MKMRVLTAGMVLMIAGAAFAQTPAAKPAAQPAKESQPEKKEEKKSLKVGDKAPALTIEKWVKGEPVTGFEKGKVYVVEFWATWCGPCIKAFPHLSELQAKYKDKLTIIGVNIWEERTYSDATLEKVKKFVTEQGDKMAYTVAYDGAAKAMDQNWMAAAGRNGIPSAFIVNQDGIVAYAGHPAQMDKALEEIIAGKYDIKAAADASKKEAEEAKKQQEKMAAQQKEMEPVFTALGSNDFDKAITLIDERLAAKSAYSTDFAFLKFRVLVMGMKDYEKAFAWAPEAAEKYLTTKNDAMTINSMAWMMLDGEGASKGDPKVALKLAETASKLTDGQDGMILDTKALAQFKTGDIDGAIATQKKAIELVEKDNRLDEDGRKEIKARLAEYEAAKK